MGRSKGESLASVLENKLAEAGLPIDPSEVVGGLYRFECEQGLVHHVLCGTIQAIEFSHKEGGLMLYVSNPRFWGCQLIGIKYCDGKWKAMIVIHGENASDQIEYFEGMFTPYAT